MGEFANVKAKQLRRALKKAGFIPYETASSHTTFIHPETHRKTTIAMHPGVVPKPIVHKIMKQAGLTAEELKKLLQ